MRRRRLFLLRIGVALALGATIFLLESYQTFGTSHVVTLAAIFLLLADSASLSRGLMRDAFLVLGSIAFGLTAVEVFATLSEAKTSPAVSDLYSPMPIVGWGPSRAGRFHEERLDLSTGHAIFDVDYTIDENLVRRTMSADSGPAIVFFGDSFTFGEGLNDSETLPQQFSDLLDRDVRVLNLAQRGYGPNQFLRILQEGLYSSLIGPTPRMFVYLTAPWQAERNACKVGWARPAPRFILQDDKVMLAGTCGDAEYTALKDRLREFASYRRYVEPTLLKPNDADVELYIRTLIAAVKLAKERYGTRTIVPYLRNGAYLLSSSRFTDDLVITRLREGGAIVLDATYLQQEKREPALWIRGDGHPTGVANRIMARALVKFIGENFPDVLPPGLSKKGRS